VLETRKTALNELNITVERLLTTYRNIPNPDVMVYDLWTAKDILAHLTFWHESFARNAHDLVRKMKPNPLKGKLSDLNQCGVDEMKPYPLTHIINRFQAAHATIQNHILNPVITSIPYKKGSRDYTPEEHLDITQKHISLHLRDVVKVCHL
jgi:hypothetical protein